jgi:hypothetical protein
LAMAFDSRSYTTLESPQWPESATLNKATRVRLRAYGGFFALEFCGTGRMMGVPMSDANSRKVFLVVAGGNPAAERHFEDTIQRKRNLEEVRRFLPSQEIENLERIYHGSNFIVWGAVPPGSSCAS